jgi:Isochorismatase family
VILGPYGRVLANTCVEATARCGAELGYHVTLVRDATAALSSEAMHAPPMWRLTAVPSTEAAENTGNARLGNKAADAADLIRRRRFIDRLSCAEGFVLDVIGISAGIKITLPDKR